MRLVSLFNRILPRPLRPVELAAHRYLRWSRLVVQSGPFRGMHYLSRAHGSELVPKIAGTYEMELHPFLPRLIAGRPDGFIDVGAAEGYYAVGAAVAGWVERIVAFEFDPEARAALTALMTRNAVPPSRIELRGVCTAGELEALLAHFQRPAMIMDAEGCEALLLDPVRVPHLASCRILLECHDFVLPGLADEIRRRMEPTHTVTAVEPVPRRAEDLVCPDPVIRRLPTAIRRRLLDERRPFERHGWLWLAPRNAGGSA